ncbi:hypothetical protein EW146_g3848 [Bondarzewia mesenterica]|uniref:DUF6534 domain-containing protein n=1 Tax=Bondarzewia mesenterica TaxID=1095465 RepID=A0A4S4LY65_9AGAM|nr:hypothetical protein EW146_g3848 [Bondarzewia mesenterica]
MAIAQTSLDLSFGALLIGALIAFFVYGVTCSQVWRFYTNYPKDSTSVKALVALIWVLDTLHRIFTSHCLWFYLVSKGGSNPAALLSANWSLVARVIPSEVAVTLVECFFVVRVWIFSGRKSISWLLLVPVLLSLGMKLMFVHPLSKLINNFPRFDSIWCYIVKAFKYPLFADALKEQWLVVVFCATRASADVLISCVLCLMLYRAGRTSYHFSSTGIISTLIKYSLTTGILASTFALVVLIVYIVMPLNMVYIAVYEVYGTLFFSAMLTSLNSRRALQAAANRSLVLSPYNTGTNNPQSVIIYANTQKHTACI